MLFFEARHEAVEGVGYGNRHKYDRGVDSNIAATIRLRRVGLVRFLEARFNGNPGLGARLSRRLYFAFGVFGVLEGRRGTDRQPDPEGEHGETDTSYG